MLSFTPFGLVFLAVATVLLVRQRRWLIALLAVSAVLHAPAVAVIHPSGGTALGITPWLAACVFAGVHLMALLWQRRRLDFGATPLVRRVFLGWTIFAAWGVASAFALPFVFEGIPTYNPEHLLSLATPPEPLRWRPINAVQAFNLAVTWGVLLYVLQLAREPGFPRRFLAGLLLAAGVSIVLSVWQRVEVLAGLPPMALMDGSLNPSYAQTVGFGLGPWLRLNWPFSEPSYASVWFAAVYAAGLALWLFSARAALGIATMTIGLLGIVNTMGGSGMASAIVVTVLSCLAALLRLFRVSSAQRKQALPRLLALPAIGLLFLALLAAGLQHERFAELNFETIYRQTIVARIYDHRFPMENGLSRTVSNLHAIEVVKRTGGLGAGLGANRASSHVLNLASNLGVPATLLFFVLLLVPPWFLLRRPAPDDAAWFVVGGQAGLLLGIAAGIPDLGWPAWWVWVIAAFGLLAAGHAGSARDGAEIAGQHQHGDAVDADLPLDHHARVHRHAAADMG